MKIRFSYIIAISAFFVAGCAAYYSVFGLSQLFAGASTAVIIMASSLEFSKIIAVSLLQRFWSKLSKGLRIYLLIGIFVLVCVTSAGIYGFLSNAYQKTASKYQISENEISVLNSKKEVFEKNIANNQTIINSKTKRVEQLGALRSTQETRLDSAKSNINRSRARTDIATATLEIQSLNKDIDNLNTKNVELLDSANSYSTKSIDSKSKSTTTSEIGPLKYLAELTGAPMDKVVNWFILLLIFVFDPLAVALVISFNKVLELERSRDAEKNIKDIPAIVKPITLAHVDEPPVEEIIPQEIEPKEEAVIEPEIILEPEPEPKRLTVEETTQEAMKELTKPEPTPEIPIAEPPVIPTGKIEFNDIKEVKRGHISNLIERIGSNKIVKDGNLEKIFFKRKQ